MSSPNRSSYSTISVMSAEREKRAASQALPGDGGGGTYDDMEPRVAALEAGMDKVLAKLEELREGQHKAELAATKQEGDLKASIAEFGGKIATLTEASAGLRRDVDRLPSKYDVTVIMIAVIGGLSATVLLIKNLWPFLSKAFAP